MVELLAGAGGGAVRLVSPTLTPELPRLEKLEKLERHWPTLENAEKKHSWILKFKSLKESDIVIAFSFSKSSRFIKDNGLYFMILKFTHNEHEQKYKVDIL